SRRGYHSLLFDGPGQGEMLIEHGLPLRPDWENVVRPVVDFAVTLPHVDPARIALSGWSLGGYFPPRAASGESRIAACIADPGLRSIADGLRKFAANFGAGVDAVADLTKIESSVLDRMWAVITQDRLLNWKVVQRGFWVHRVTNLREFLRAVASFAMEGR